VAIVHDHLDARGRPVRPQRRPESLLLEHAVAVCGRLAAGWAWRAEAFPACELRDLCWALTEQDWPKWREAWELAEALHARGDAAALDRLIACVQAHVDLEPRHEPDWEITHFALDGEPVPRALVGGPHIHVSYAPTEVGGYTFTSRGRRRG
jgi:hypothetical protein